MGLATEAPPSGEFLSCANDQRTKVALVIGRYPVWLCACLRPKLPVFFVGDGVDAFAAHDDEELIALLCGIENNINLFTYGEALESSEDGVFYLGYPLELTPSELSIVAFLVSRGDDGATQEELMSVCVGDTHRKTSILAQHTAAINKKARAVLYGRTLVVSERKIGASKLYKMAKYI